MTTLYTGKAHVTGGRDGAVRTDDGRLAARLALPPALGGDGNGTNPEELFAAAYAACFASTVATIAKAEARFLRADLRTGAAGVRAGKPIDRGGHPNG